MKIVTITGCLGFMASHLTRLCLEQGWMVYGIDKCTYAANLNLLGEFQNNPNFHFEEIGIENTTFFPDCDYIVNMAAETHVDNSIIGTTEFIASNIHGVYNILKMLHKRRNTARRPTFLHFSTDEVYGDIDKGFFDENSFLNPSNPYSATKAAGDLIIQAWARTFGHKYILVRPTNNYGEHQYPEKLIPLSVKNLQREHPIILHNQGEPYRTWLHAEDTARAILMLMGQNTQEGVFNISGPDILKNIEIVKTIIKAFHGEDCDWKQYVDLTYKRVGQDVRYAVDDSKLRSLGWEPKRRVLKDIPGLVKHFKEYYRW